MVVRESCGHARIAEEQHTGRRIGVHRAVLVLQERIHIENASAVKQVRRPQCRLPVQTGRQRRVSGQADRVLAVEARNRRTISYLLRATLCEGRVFAEQKVRKTVPARGPGSE